MQADPFKYNVSKSLTFIVIKLQISNQKYDLMNSKYLFSS